MWAMLVPIPLSHPNYKNVESLVCAPLSPPLLRSQMEAQKLHCAYVTILPLGCCEYRILIGPGSHVWLHSNWLLFIFFTSSLFGGEGFSFRVNGGLAIELVFRVCLKNGLGSFLGWPIFIFSPYPLGSA